jgi:type III secretion protein C
MSAPAAPAPPAWAASSRLSSKPFIYNAQQIQLIDLLRDFSGAASVPLVVADGVTGVVNAKFNLTPQSFLEVISRSFSLIWYFDGSAVYMYPSQQLQNRLFKLGGGLATGAEAKLKSFGLLDPRYPVKFMQVGSLALAMASGPPRHIEILEGLIAVLSEAEVSPPSPEVTKAIALVHASAVDRTVMGTTVPGMASTLNQIFGQSGETSEKSDSKSAMKSSTDATIAQMERFSEGPPESRAKREAAKQAVMRSLAPGASSAPQAPQSVAPNPAVGSALYQPVPAPAPVARPAGRVSFIPDETTNLVLVRAPQDLIADIEAMVAKLDVPRLMIEVEASIIDISSDEVATLGFDWEFNSGSTQVSAASGASSKGGGFNMTTLLTSGASTLLARVRALEVSGRARVVSQPKVLGAANRTAVLSDKRTASVRVAGNQDARLYSIETGTTLQVTPRIVPDPVTPTISLELMIEDGNFSGDAVDGVPIAVRTSISTIATLAEGQALLIGGIAVESASDGRSGVPWLSRLPLWGPFFRTDSSQSSHRQRLFLITPRRVGVASAAAAVAPLPAAETSINAPKVRIP